MAYTLDLPLLRRLSEIAGIPGREARIRQVIAEIIGPMVDELRTDRLGNLVALKRGTSGKKVLLAGHMDEIGFLVKYIDDNGFVRLHPLGGFDPKTLVAQRVIAHGTQDIVGVIATKPIHVMTPEERAKNDLKLEDLVVDFCLPAEELRQILKPGDWVSRKQDLIEMGHGINGKSLDNRLSVYALVEAIRHFEGCAHDVYFVFTVQEEVGLRGAQVVALEIQPDFGIALDVTITYDLPSAKPYEHVTQLGKGPGIKHVDGSLICDPRLVKFLEQTAEAHGIPFQRELMTAGGTDAGMLQRMVAGGSIAGGLSVPLRHLHTSVELVHKEDLRHWIQLLILALREMGSYDFSWD